VRLVLRFTRGMVILLLRGSVKRLEERVPLHALCNFKSLWVLHRKTQGP
jgi:hypothetical protein